MFYLAPHIHVTPVRDRVVILDLLKDKYTALSADLTQALLFLTGQKPPGFEVSQVSPQTLERAVKRLLGQGVLLTKPPKDPIPPAWSTAVKPAATRWPSTRWETTKRTRLSAGAFLSVMGALSEVSIALRTTAFQSFVARVSREPVAARAVTKSEQSVLDEFFFARPWFPVEPICRLDAPALCLHLRRQGHPAQLVFGVTLESFAAHCWVQVGDRVLKEPHETISGYSPILIV